MGADGLALPAGHPGRPFQWRLLLNTPTGGGSGLVNVTVTLIDPGTGITYQRVMPVDVNAGDNLNNGRFQRGLTGWARVLSTAADNDLDVKRPDTAPAPWDLDDVLWMGNGFIRYEVTGLTENTSYKVTGSVIGTSSKIRVYKTTAGTLQGEDAGTSTTAWVDRSFDFTTAAGQTSAVIQLEDTDTVDPARGSNACVTVVSGTSCWDDVRLFKN